MFRHRTRKLKPNNALLTLAKRVDLFVTAAYRKAENGVLHLLHNDNPMFFVSAYIHKHVILVDMNLYLLSDTTTHHEKSRRYMTLHAVSEYEKRQQGRWLLAAFKLACKLYTQVNTIGVHTSTGRIKAKNRRIRGFDTSDSLVNKHLAAWWRLPIPVSTMEYINTHPCVGSVSFCITHDTPDAVGNTVYSVPAYDMQEVVLSALSAITVGILYYFKYPHRTETDYLFTKGLIK